MILYPWRFENKDTGPWIITRPATDGEPIIREGKFVSIDNHFQNKFWAIPVTHPSLVPELICVDLRFSSELFKVYQIEPETTE